MAITSRERPPWDGGTPPTPTSVHPPEDPTGGKPKLLALLLLVPLAMVLPWLGRCMFHPDGCAAGGGDPRGGDTPWWDDGSGGGGTDGTGGPWGPGGGGPGTNGDGTGGGPGIGPDGLLGGDGTGLPAIDLAKCLLYGSAPRWLNPRAGTSFSLAAEEVVQARSIGCLTSGGGESQGGGDRVSPDTFPGTNVTYLQHEYDPLIHGTTFTYRVCSDGGSAGETLRTVTFGHLGECCLLSTSYFGGTAQPGGGVTTASSSKRSSSNPDEVSDAYADGSIRVGIDDDTCSYGVTFTEGFPPSPGSNGCEVYELTYLGYVPSSIDVPVTFLLSTPPSGASTPDRPVDTPLSRLAGRDLYFMDSLGGGADCSVDGWDFTSLPDGSGGVGYGDDRPVDRYQSKPLDVVEGEDGFPVDGAGGAEGLNGGRPIDRPGLPGDVDDGTDGTDGGGGGGSIGRPIDRPGAPGGGYGTDVDGGDDTGGSGGGGRPIDRPGGEGGGGRPVEGVVDTDGGSVDGDSGDGGGGGTRPIDRPGLTPERPQEGGGPDGDLDDIDGDELGGGDGGTRPIDRPGLTPERPQEGGGGPDGDLDDIDGDELVGPPTGERPIDRPGETTPGRPQEGGGGPGDDQVDDIDGDELVPPPGVEGTRPLDRPPPPGQTWPPTVPPRPVPTGPTPVDDGGVDGDSIDAPPDPFPVEDDGVDRPIDRLECREAMFVGVDATADLPIRTMKVDFV